MRRVASIVLYVVSLAAVAFGAYGIARGQAVSPSGGLVLAQETQDGNLREITAPDDASGSLAPQQPAIGFIDSPSATCYQPDPARDACFINWYYLSVDASPNYMVTMTVTLNDYGPIAHTQGFFQTSMYVPYNMLGQGIKVTCGSLNAAGAPFLGNAYAYTIRARDSANLGTANYGTVYCPAYQP